MGAVVQTEPVSLREIALVAGLVRDSKAFLWVLLIPWLIPLFLIRLGQWYYVRHRYSDLVATNGVDEDLSHDFHAAKIKLWFAVLICPTILLCYNLPRLLK